MVRREAAKASVLIPPPADEGALTAKPPNNVYVTDNGMPFKLTRKEGRSKIFAGFVLGQEIKLDPQFLSFFKCKIIKYLF